MEEPKERVFSEGLQAAGMCLSVHASWQKEPLLMRLGCWL